MKYRNKLTGAIIDVKSKLSGGNWQAVEPANTSVKEETEVEETEVEETKVAPVQPKKRKVSGKNE